MPRAATPDADRPDSLADRVYARLKADIFDFRLLPGDRFTENEVAARSGASRTPVRQALYRLQREGLLEVRFRNGWQVRPIDFGHIDACYELRIVLECAAARKLCEGGAPGAALAALTAIWQVPPADRLTDPAVVAALDEAFHLGLVEAAGNAEMARVHRELSDKIRIVRRLDFTEPARVTATYDEHAAILAALGAGDAAQGEQRLRAHIETSRVEVRKITLHRLSEIRRAAAAGG
ncbi:GntR family transcriptional regulator [Pseudothauera rhizosphaerae]|uniref:GntR family transcriptional regulator n=1 Tax=Pseudothauera rhizosphaerae TaxID=2565932 RepID=A0A4S4AIG8_9RHOO|nr:GntR family transcriptional regulator [Pseudothauera rhizosphaerae]THF58636.1 GntR family transcriptional regulator [Pseudothauera rhizosphaerae]